MDMGQPSLFEWVFGGLIAIIFYLLKQVYPTMSQMTDAIDEAIEVHHIADQLEDDEKLKVITAQFKGLKEEVEQIHKNSDEKHRQNFGLMNRIDDKLDRLIERTGGKNG